MSDEDEEKHCEECGQPYSADFLVKQRKARAEWAAGAEERRKSWLLEREKKQAYLDSLPEVEMTKDRRDELAKELRKLLTKERVPDAR